MLGAISGEIAIGDTYNRIVESVHAARDRFNLAESYFFECISNTHSFVRADLLARSRAGERASNTSNPSLQTCSGSPTAL
jgi:hypothetical protein